MRNLHKYYYKDYFKPHLDDVDDDNKNLSLKYLYLEEEKNELSNSEDNRNRKSQLEKEISAIRDLNKSIIINRNKQLLTGKGFANTDFSPKDRNKLINCLIIPNVIPPNDNDNQCRSFPLSVSYPGLVTGIGINHEAKIEGEFKLGVNFDWTRGMPVVYGSSVKGVLRSWFVDFYKKNYPNSKIDADDLMMEIFEGRTNRDIEAEKNKYGDDWENKKRNVKNRIYKNVKSIYNRDIFFDAVITHTDPKGRILCSDSITPHGGNPLKNPIPITFMKIAPGCKLEFRFKLTPSKLDTNFDIEKKIALFKEILTTVGVGAKTNVGYGQLKEAK